MVEICCMVLGIYDGQEDSETTLRSRAMCRVSLKVWLVVLPSCGKPRPGSEWNKGWRELLVFDLRKGRRGKAYFLRERSEQEM